MPQPSRWADVAMSEKRFRKLCKLAGIPTNAERWSDDDTRKFDDMARKMMYRGMDSSSTQQS